MKKKTKEMRFDIDFDIFKKYKLICVEMEISIPKQTAALISQFVEVQKENLKKIREAKGE